MPRPAKKFKTKAEEAKHAEHLRKRRARHAEAVTLRMASQAAEGQADFQALVEAEKQRMDANQQQTAGRKGAAQSPKVTTAARDNLSRAFDLMGGVPALVVWGRANPTEFYRIWARLIPKESAESTQALPLETLLSKLASKEELSVGQAAYEIGMETLEAAREQVSIEDAMSSDGKTIN